MATQKKNSQRYWLAALLAAALAEKAHAPLINDASTSDEYSPAGNRIASVNQKPIAIDKKLPRSPEGFSLTDLTPVQQLQKPPLLPLPPLVGEIYPSLDAAHTQPISLLQTGQSDESLPVLGSPIAENNPVAADPPPTSAVTNSIAEPVVSDPPSLSNPAVGTVLDPIVAVPEPSGVIFLLGSLTLLGRRRSNL